MVVARPYELRKSLSCGSEAPCGALPTLAHPLAWSALPKAPKSPQSNGQTLTMQFAHGVIEIHGCLKDSSYRLRELLDPIAAVVLLDPRQTGKTTLAFAQKQSRFNAIFELPYAQRQLDDPEAFFMAYPNQLVILDEVQRMPGVFRILRGVAASVRLGASFCCWGLLPACCSSPVRAWRDASHKWN